MRIKLRDINQMKILESQNHIPLEKIPSKDNKSKSDEYCVTGNQNVVGIQNTNSI